MEKHGDENKIKDSFYFNSLISKCKKDYQATHFLFYVLQDCIFKLRTVGRKKRKKV